MPYIESMRRLDLDGGMCPMNAGELNYQFTMTILRHPAGEPGLADKLEAAARRYLSSAELRYQRINDVLGALTGCVCEYIRRASQIDPNLSHTIADVTASVYTLIAAPYEEKAIIRNGDITYDTPNDTGRA